MPIKKKLVYSTLFIQFFSWSFIFDNCVKYIYHDYNNTILDGHIVCDFVGCSLIIFSHTGQELM
jgi:hypothetical protein